MHLSLNVLVGATLLITMGIYVLGFFYQYSKRKSFPQLYHEIDKCNKILSQATLSKRAITNQRLVIAFGIENAFTTTNGKTYKDYRQGVGIGLHRRHTEAGRQMITEGAKQTIKEYMIKEPGGPFSLIPLIRITVFCAVLTIFYPDVVAPPIDDVEVITELIDTLWYDSKDSLKTEAARWCPISKVNTISTIAKDRECLFEKLKQIFNLPSINPQNNPMNVLLPAYMGIWRVVLYGFLEIRFRSTKTERIKCARVLDEYLSDPSTKGWYLENNCISAQSIVAETLRLYPPTRKIYSIDDNGELHGIDIETLHRVGGVWGRQPLKFDVQRWKKEGIDVVKTKEYMPFGAKFEGSEQISKCPARRRGGPQICAVLIGVFMQEFGDEWELVEELPPDGPLERTRGAFDSLRMRRKG